MSAVNYLAESITNKDELRSVVHVRDKESEDRILDMISTSGALLKGHFKLESGQHSQRFFRFTTLEGNHDNLDFVATKLMSDLRNERVDFDVLVMQESAGRSLGELIASKLDKRVVIAETDNKNRPTGNLINDSELFRGDKALIVSDLSTTGGGLTTMTDSVRNKKADPIAVILFATRNKEEMAQFQKKEHVKVYALADLSLEDSTYGEKGTAANETNCEECRKGTPVIASWET